MFFLNEADSGVEWARRTVHLAPGDGRLWAHLSSLLSMATDNIPAIEAAKRAIILKPASTAGYLNLTTCTLRIVQLEQSRSSAYRGLMIDPGLHELAVSASECELSYGNIAKGWALYERRLHLPDALSRLGPAHLPGTERRRRPARSWFAPNKVSATSSSS